MNDQDRKNLNKWKSDLINITYSRKVIHKDNKIVHNSPLGTLIKTVEGSWRWQKRIS